MKSEQSGNPTAAATLSNGTANRSEKAVDAGKSNSNAGGDHIRAEHNPNSNAGAGQMSAGHILIPREPSRSTSGEKNQMMENQTTQNQTTQLMPGQVTRSAEVAPLRTRSTDVAPVWSERPSAWSERSTKSDQNYISNEYYDCA
jgi:hypothetical protein